MAAVSVLATLATLALVTGAAAGASGPSPAAVLSTAVRDAPAAVLSTAVPDATAAPPPAAGTPAPQRAGWRWPLDPRPEILGPFDPPAEPWGRGHRGVDLAAAVGQAVLSPADGRVGFAGTIAGRGVVVIVHAGGLRSTFEPVRDQIAVGTAVRAGQPVAAVDATAGHCAPATCLHWGVLRGDSYLDPVTLLTRRPIVLLPLG